MKPLDFHALDEIAKSNIADALTQQTLNSTRTVQVPTLQGYLPQPVVLPVIERVCLRQANQPAAKDELPPQITTEAKFFVAVENTPKGPFTVRQIKEFLTAGIISSQTLCWTVGWTAWKPIHQTEEITL